MSETLIHPTAIVEAGAELGTNVKIGPWCTVGPKVKLGDGSELKSHVVLEGNTQIGKNNVIFPFAVVGVIPQDLKYRGEDTKLTLGDNNTIREGVSIHTGTVSGGGLTSIGSNNLLMGYTHVGHDTHIGNHCIFANYVGIAGHVIVDDFANLGGQVGVSQFVRIGSHSYITGQGGLDKDVPPFCIGYGRPCKIRSANIVGMRRRDFSVETIQKINETIKLWMRPEVQKEQCLLEIDSQYGSTPEVKQFIKFVNDSKIGTIK